jgi:hypothetical protein
MNELVADLIVEVTQPIEIFVADANSRLGPAIARGPRPASRRKKRWKRH